MPVLKQNQVFAGRYVLSQLIGEGGFSEVWKAEDQMADDAVVAMKIYAPSKGLDDYGLRQFRNEFSLTHNLSHPHILKVHHFDIADGSPYLIMPFCPYGSLASELADKGVLSERKLALVMSQIGAALDEVHNQDPPIIHQDIKPDNILLSQPDCYMLADFGISSRIRHTLRKATSEMQTLTVAYAPPERFDRHPSSDASSDIFSLGVTLYEMCTNTVPWDGAGGQCLLKGASIPALPVNYSPELNEILEACMSVDRTKRPTAADIHLWARHYLETGKWPQPKKESNSGSRKKSFVPYLVAAAVVLVALAGFWFFKGQDYLSAADSVEIAAIETENKAYPLVDSSDENQLENKLKSMEAQLVKANEQLTLQDSLNKVLVQNKDAQPVRNGEQLVNKEAVSASEKAESQQSAAALREERARNIKLELQKRLNQISDPGNSKEVRSGLKQETLARFANASVRVLDESDGGQKEFRAGIFLTLLLSSPHQVVVKEVKTDQNNKVTEIRLSKRSISSNM